MKKPRNYAFLPHKPPVDLYLIFKNSSCKNQFRRTGFLVCKILQATLAVKIKFEKSLKNPVRRTGFFRN